MISDRLEIYDAKRKEKVTLKDGLSKNIVDDAAGKFLTDKGEKIPFGDALKKNLVSTLLNFHSPSLTSEQNKLGRFSLASFYQASLVLAGKAMSLSIEWAIVQGAPLGYALTLLTSI